MFIGFIVKSSTSIESNGPVVPFYMSSCNKEINIHPTLNHNKTQFNEMQINVIINRQITTNTNRITNTTNTNTNT